MKRGIIKILLSMAIMTTLLSGCGSIEKDEPVSGAENEADEDGAEEDQQAALKEADVMEDDAEEKERVPAAVVSKETYYKYNGSILFWNEYEYDSAGNQTKKTLYYGDGSIYDWSEYEYDSDGNRIKRTRYYPDGSSSIVYKYEYDSAGNETKRIRYNADGISEFRYSYEYEYDSDGNIVGEILDRTGANRLEYRYEYDSAGNRTKETRYGGVGSGAWSGWEHEYDSAGNHIKETHYYSDDSIDYWREYEYDSTGNLTKETLYDDDGSIKYWYEYEYDSMGNLTKITHTRHVQEGFDYVYKEEEYINPIQAYPMLAYSAPAAEKPFYKPARKKLIEEEQAKETGADILIEKSNIWSEAQVELTEATISLNDGESYSIKENSFVLDKDHFVPDHSTVRYPVIEFSDEVLNEGLKEKINEIFYEAAMLHYYEELGKEMNAVYSCRYFIVYAGTDYISIYYDETRSSGMSSPVNLENAVTISLESGNIVSLEDFGDINSIMQEIGNYSGTIYSTVSYITNEVWSENKEEFIERWLEDDSSPYYRYYLYDGRVGFIFYYHVPGRECCGIEFSGIADYGQNS